MPEKGTPEEKLLRLIENPAAGSKDAKAAPKIKLKVLSLSQLKAIIGNIWSNKEELKSRFFNLKFINKAIIFISFLLVAYLIFDFIQGRPNLNKIYTYPLSASEDVRKDKNILEANVLALSDYLGEIKRRDIFRFVSLSTTESASQEKVAAAELTSTLKLVGIIWSKAPQAMIEDQKENKTLLVNPGDKIGEIKVKEILRDRVILISEGKELELM